MNDSINTPNDELIEPSTPTPTPTPNPDFDTWKRWTDGEFERLRYEYDLDNTSICLDLGAFYNDWGKKISDMYHSPTIYAFEAIPAIWNIGQENIVDYSNIRSLNYAVGKSNCEMTITMGPALGVSSSFYIQEEGEKINVTVRDIKEVFEELNISNVDLMKLNIEGSEYDVLERLIECNLHIHIKNIQVQFHRLTDDYLNRYNNIREKLKETHELTYEFEFIWENWKLK